VAPTEFFASNFGWKDRESGSVYTGLRSSIKFTYSNGNKSAVKGGLDPVAEIPKSKISWFGSKYNKKNSFKHSDKAD
jgi:hypothetical protein